MDDQPGLRAALRSEHETDREESLVELLDRNWAELLQELRVVQTGVQLLSGFLLTLPFQQRFQNLTAEQRDLYLIVVGLTATATAPLVSPVPLHRVLFLGVLVSACKRSAAQSHRVIGVNAHGIVLKALQITGIGDLLQVAETVATLDSEIEALLVRQRP